MTLGLSRNLHGEQIQHWLVPERNYVGKTHSQKMVDHFSNEITSTADYPPTFSICMPLTTREFPLEKQSFVLCGTKGKIRLRQEMHIYPTGATVLPWAYRTHIATWTVNGSAG